MDNKNSEDPIESNVPAVMQATEIESSDTKNNESTTKENVTLMDSSSVEEGSSKTTPTSQDEKDTNEGGVSEDGRESQEVIASSQVTTPNQNEAILETETNNDKNTDEPQNLAENMEEEVSACTSTSPNTPNAATQETVNVAETPQAQTDTTIPNSHACQTQIKTEPTDNSCPPIEEKNMATSFATVKVKSENTPYLVGVPNFITRSSLGLLAQYDSDSDEDAQEKEQANIKADGVEEVAIEANKDYRNKVVEINSESESESSSDSDVEYIAKIRKEIEITMELEDDDDAEDDGDELTAGKNKKKKAQNSMRCKGELGLEDLPPIQDLHITVPEEECIVLGKVHSIVDQLLLVSALPDSTLYDLDTVLFLDKGKRVLGLVFDVLGQVADPLYCVRFNSSKDIEEKGIKVGDAVYVAPKTEHTQFVIISSLMKMRGSDASWENDIEPPPRYLDYSDDEQEREARQRLRNKDRSANKDHENHDDASKRARDDLDETASVSSVATSNDQTQTRYTPRGGRFNRGNTHRTQGGYTGTPRYNNQRPQHQMPQNSNAASWHSNFHRPYSYNTAHMPMPPMPHMPLPINPSYTPFPQYPPFSPTMAPPPHSPTMYVPNPYAMRPPRLSPRIPSGITKTRSPSPPPPGLD